MFGDFIDFLSSSIMKSAIIILVFIILIFITLMSDYCSIWFRYYDRYNGLYQQAGESADKEALKKLIRATNSRSFWDRYYAFLFLGNLAIDYPKQFEPDVYDGILDVFVSGLDDSERTIHRIIIERLPRIGSDGIRRAFDRLVEFVSECREDDIGWFSAEALAIPVSETHTERAIKTLTEALNCEPPPEQSPSAPQLRRAALRALVDLVRAAEIDPEYVLSKARHEIVDPAFMREVEKVFEAEKGVKRRTVNNGEKSADWAE
jgi:hypothetical protein